MKLIHRIETADNPSNQTKTKIKLTRRCNSVDVIKTNAVNSVFWLYLHNRPLEERLCDNANPG